jgi:RNA polymerase sigma-70 factor (ECF subfamily)
MAPPVALQNLSEGELLERIKERDEIAFSLFYERMAPKLYGLVFKVLNDAKEAEDVTQEGFLHIWNKASAYEAHRSSASTWAFLIFRNKAIDRLRSRERRDLGVAKIAQAPEIAPASEEQPDRRLDRKDEAARIHATLDEMPVEQKEALVLAFFQGFTHIQIAEKTGTPIGTIKARIRRGLVKLSERLGGQLA